MSATPAPPTTAAHNTHEIVAATIAINTIQAAAATLSASSPDIPDSVDR